MSLAVELQPDMGLMPYVRFERVPVEDPVASRELGRYVAKDIDMALVTPPGSKDVMKHKVANWLKQLAIDASSGRIPDAWVQRYKQAYEAWSMGQELPLEGFPIKGWGVISPAQQETLIKMHILTVETLAALNDEGLKRIGMGAVDLKNKAEAWLKNMSKAGKPTQEIAALKRENESLQARVLSLESKLSNAMTLIEKSGILSENFAEKPMTADISANDLLGDD